MAIEVNNKSKRTTGLKDKFTDLLLAWFPALIAFLLIPFAIYLPNQVEFNYDLITVLPYICFLIVSFLALFFIFLLKPLIRGRVAVSLFCLGSYLALSDAFAPVLVGEMMDGFLPESIPEPMLLCFLDFSLGLLFVFLAFKLPVSIVRRIGPVIIGVLFLVNLIIIGFSLSDESHFVDQEINTIPAPKALAKRGNIYHIIFDGFNSYTFLDSLDEVATFDDFDGFIFFKNNLSNYIFTGPSVSSFMTGTFYEQGGFRAWADKWRSQGVIKNLFEAGYEVSQYIPKLSYKHDKTSHVVLRQIDKRQYNYNRHLFASLWLLRVSPIYLHQEACNKVRGAFSSKHSKLNKFFGYGEGWNAKLMREVISGEK